MVVKLGGSVITEKGSVEEVDAAALSQAVEIIAGSSLSEELIVVHGAGSFGHYYADKHGLSSTEGSTDASGVWAVHDSMRRLNDRVVTAFHDEGVPALPVRPLSVGARSRSDTLSLSLVSVRAMLSEGFLPVLHGDVIVHESRGATILSGDTVVGFVGRALGASRVGLCSEVPGVLDDDGTVIPRIESFGDVTAYLGGSDETDVTGGMAGKVREMLALPMPASIFSLENLGAFLVGESPGTVIHSEH